MSAAASATIRPWISAKKTASSPVGREGDEFVDRAVGYDFGRVLWGGGDHRACSSQRSVWSGRLVAMVHG